MRTLCTVIAAFMALALCVGNAHAETRARDIGIPFFGTTGPLNAITDVKGVEVGHSTIIEGKGEHVVGKGPIRTGVTAIFPLGKDSLDGVAGGFFALNGVGEMTGTVLLEEYGGFFGPIMLTGTMSVGMVRDATIEWSRDNIPFGPDLYVRSIPIVAETFDGRLHDVYGFHVKKEHVFEAINSAKSGPVEEGGVGSGTGMVVYGYKGGIGTASRVLPEKHGGYTVGVLVQANHGSKYQLTIAGIPVGRELIEKSGPSEPKDGDGSIIIVVATDAPLFGTYLKRVARRAALGLALTGSVAADGSGDIFIAFSTANKVKSYTEEPTVHSSAPRQHFTPIFEATVQATEEAIINAMISAKTMEGIDGRVVEALPHDDVRKVLKKYNRLSE